jgi:hypothetical protein
VRAGFVTGNPDDNLRNEGTYVEVQRQTEATVSTDSE